MREHAHSGALTEVSFLILLALYTPRHGYAIMQFVEEMTAGRLVLGAGTLYGALNALSDKGWVAPADDAAGRRKTYTITDAGREICHAELARLRALAAMASAIMEDVK